MSTTLEQIQYGFDRNSRRTWQRRSLTATQDQHYGYDSLGQVSAAARGSLNVNLTAISGRPASAQSWDYDPTGNWRGYHSASNGTTTLDQHRVHDRGNRLTQIEDNPNNMILDRVGRMRQMAPDADGDWDGKLEITWDAWSRITSVKNNGTVVGSYGYDGRHRRTTREGDSITLHSYYNDVWRPVEERKGAETTAFISYLWGSRHRDDLVRRDRAVGGTTLNETRYVLMDYFNPASITDEAGEVKERYAFSAFGLRTILNPDFTERSSSECGLEFAFQGQFLDSESGLLNYGYRYYSPQLGRWTCKDPIQERGGANLYVYAKNTPTNQVDKLGLLTDLDYETLDHALQQRAGWDWLNPGANWRPNGQPLIVEATRILSSSQALSALSDEIGYACNRACGNDGEMFEHEGIKTGIATEHILAIGSIGGEFHIWAQKGHSNISV
jgi:RHS repeat-associated protein